MAPDPVSSEIGDHDNGVMIGAPAALEQVAEPDLHRAGEPAAAVIPPLVRTALSPEPLVHIEVVVGGQTHVKAPLSIVGRYDGLDLGWQAKAFDRQLDSWLTRAIDLGLIGTRLGEVFPVRMRHSFESGRVNAENLLLVGMGTPGQMSADDVRYMMSNVTVAIKSMGHEQVSIGLFGVRRNELSIEQAVRGFLEGIVDGHERFRSIVDSVTDDRQMFADSYDKPLFIYLVEPDPDKAEHAHEALEAFSHDHSIKGLQLEVGWGTSVPPDVEPEKRGNDTVPDVPVTMLRATCAPASAQPSLPTDLLSPYTTGTEVFQFSALSEVAAITVREQEVNAYYVRRLPGELIRATDSKKRESLGKFFANYVIPVDLRRLVETASNLTIVVDATTAALPWEMAAFERRTKTNCLGTSIAVSRRFHSLLSPPPSSAPALNDLLKVLVIADPASGNLALPNALEEGFAVISALERARAAWNGAYRFELTARLGSHESPDSLEPRYDSVRQLGDWVKSIGPCDPLEIASLMLSEQFDVIHYAGHGGYDKGTGRGGWLLDEHCFLSAHEVFKVPQVPRLVFANACFTAVTKALPAANRNLGEHREQLVGLAQAFFARGIPNYIGTGWQVDDRSARECARWFYARVLGLHDPEPGSAVVGTSPPATIGQALLDARQILMERNPDSSTWGAYQHYGRVGDKLLPLPNEYWRRNGEAAV